ncbi:retrovirus-related pol polyprotein from transposon TNT 1-94 [Tanacetum coccineum]
MTPHQMGKAKRSSFKSLTVTRSKKRLDLLHMNLCSLMRIETINGKKYIMVIVDDYSRYTWTLFLRSKDETPKVLKDFLKMIQRKLQAQVITVRIDRGTEFLNKTLYAYFNEDGRVKAIEYQLIMEYLVNISKKASILELKRKHLKITVLTTNMLYPSRKIWRICACTSLKTTKEQDLIRRI